MNASGNTATTAVTIDGNKTVTANFAPISAAFGWYSFHCNHGDVVSEPVNFGG